MVWDEDQLREIMDYNILYGHRNMMRRAPTDKEIESIARKANDIPDGQFIVIKKSYKKQVRDQLSYVEDDQFGITIKTDKFEKDDILSFDDKELLIEYAPKLFSEWEGDLQSLKQAMYDLVEKTYQYKFMRSPTNFHNNLNSALSTKYSEDRSGKEDSLRGHLEKALALMSRYDGFFEPGARVGSTIQDNFREKLPKSLAARHDETVGDLVVRVIGEIIQTPAKYAIKEIHVHQEETKKDIEEYLNSLNSKITEEFMGKIAEKHTDSKNQQDLKSQVIELRTQGKSNKEVSEIAGVNSKTASRWYCDYTRDGKREIAIKKVGRPKKEKGMRD